MPGNNNSQWLWSENSNCAGCGMSLALNLLGDTLGNKVKMAIPACCGIVTAHSFPFSSYKIPIVATTFAASSAVASGMKAVQDMNNEEGHVIAFAGDGGTFDIGMAALSATAERNENIIYICYDNEVYGNTGAQRSSATPLGAKTTTTPGGKKEMKKDIMSIMIEHNIPYAASLNMGYPDDFARKVKTASQIKGFRFLYILSPCIPNWKIEPSHTVKLARLAVETGVFPLFEVFSRHEYHITYKPEELIPLKKYMELQKRFSHIDEATFRILEKTVRSNWDRILKLEQVFPPGEYTEMYSEN
ncbi:thiamine pyrophosphate-dependent enzyme [candidate division KSB1 bacterium]